MPAWEDQDKIGEALGLSENILVVPKAESTQPCGCDPGCKPRPHYCEQHRGDYRVALSSIALGGITIEQAIAIACDALRRQP